VGLERYEEVVYKIRNGVIASSTKVVFAGLDALLDLVRRCGGLDELAGLYPELATRLAEARPTSATLINGIRRLTQSIIVAAQEGGMDGVRRAAEEVVAQIKGEIEEAAERACYIASRRVEDGDTIMTNSYSTLVLRTLRLARAQGKSFRVYVTESRPGSEGWNLARELAAEGVEVTLIVDSSVRLVMKDVDKVLLSSEAVAANGALVNKVGSSLIALAAHEARVRVFALAPTYKFSPETFLGELVELGEREPSVILTEELRKAGVKAWAPLFDVTPPEYIDAIITEEGLIAPEAVAFVVREIYGWPPRVRTLEDELAKFRRLVGKHVA